MIAYLDSSVILRLVLGQRGLGEWPLLDTLEVVEPTRPILSRAGQPFPINLGTLDAIHLATAMLWREASQKDLIVATHNARLGLAARAVGFDIMGA